MVYNLKPQYSRNKSFYNKAVVEERDGIKALTSYSTLVAFIDDKGLHRTWHGYSATTQKHIHDFALQNGAGGCGKQRWVEMEVENVPEGFTPCPSNYTVSLW
jgi:hypothetical protein